MRVGSADRNQGAAGDGGEVLPQSAVCNQRRVQQDTHQPHHPGPQHPGPQVTQVRNHPDKDFYVSECVCFLVFLLH